MVDQADDRSRPAVAQSGQSGVEHGEVHLIGTLRRDGFP